VTAHMLFKTVFHLLGSQGRQQGKNLDLGDNLPRHIYLHQLQQKWLENQFVARQLQDEKEMEHWCDIGSHAHLFPSILLHEVDVNSSLKFLFFTALLDRRSMYQKLKRLEMDLSVTVSTS
jgi:hypothetical protein